MLNDNIQIILSALANMSTIPAEMSSLCTTLRQVPNGKNNPSKLDLLNTHALDIHFFYHTWHNLLISKLSAPYIDTSIFSLEV